MQGTSTHGSLLARNVAIEMITGQCHVFLRFRANIQKEPLILREVPERPWQRAAADIMTFKGHDYLVAVDCYSKFPEIAQLENKTAACEINHFNSMFARHRIPEELLTDNMPFSSRVRRVHERLEIRADDIQSYFS